MIVLGFMNLLLSFLLLILRNWVFQNVTGLSLKSQLIITLVHLIRLIDGFPDFNDTFQETFFILFSFIILASLYKFRVTYLKESDSFWFKRLVFGTLPFALLNGGLTPLAAWSLCLDAVAMCPQFYMVYATRKVPFGVFAYLMLVGSSRFFDIFVWILPEYVLSYERPPWIDLAAIIVQVVPYFVLIYYWRKKEVGITAEKTFDPTDEKAKSELFTVTVANESKTGVIPTLTQPEQEKNKLKEPVT